MKNTLSRLATLRHLLDTVAMSSQEDIQKHLAAHGFKVSQPTLSNDLRRLGATRIITSDGPRYVQPSHPLYQRQTEGSTRPTASGVGPVSLSFSGTLAVLHTRRGYAQAVANDIEESKIKDCLAVVAQDSTILAVMSEKCSREQFVDELRKVIPHLELV